MTLLVKMETFNIFEAPLRLPGSLPFVLLSLQLRLGLSAVSCQVTKLPALTHRKDWQQLGVYPLPLSL